VAKLSGASGGSGGQGGGKGPNPLANLGGFDDSLSRNLEDSPPNIQMLLDINLNVTIELGRTRLSIRKVLELGPGSIIELDRLAGEPVDLLVNDKVVAKGEVVVVDEYFGIRIISLVSPEERIKQLK
jgi:flagellar motor switch protein FliN